MARTNPTVGRVVTDNIRAEAARRRITQTMLAEILGINQKAVSMRMRGQTPWTLDDVYVIAAAFDVPLDVLLPPVVTDDPGRGWAA